MLEWREDRDEMKVWVCTAGSRPFSLEAVSPARGGMHSVGDAQVIAIEDV